MLGRPLTSSGQDGTITKKTLASMVRGATCMQQHLFNYFSTSDHWGFLEDVSLTFIDKTDPSDPLKREDCWRSTLKTMASFGLNIEESV